MENAKAPSTAEVAPKTKKDAAKKPGVGAAVGSVILFILTFLLSLLLLCTSTLHLTLSQNSLVHTIQRTDLTQITLTQNGTQNDLGGWVYTWYMEGAPTLTDTFARTALAQDEIKAVVCDYVQNMCAYLRGDSETLPTLEAAAFADVLMEPDMIKRIANITEEPMTEEDRSFFLEAAGQDTARWNSAVQQVLGRGPGKPLARFFCSLAGVITVAAALVVCIALWIVLAVRGHWRKGRMLAGCGTALALPDLLALLGCGLFLLLISVLDLIPALSFAAEGLPTLLLPMIWPGLAYALAGVVIASIGYTINGVVKARKKRAEEAEESGADPAPNQMPPEFAPSKDLAPASATQQPEPDPIKTTPEQGSSRDFVYRDLKEAAETEVLEPTSEQPASTDDLHVATFCVECGAPIAPDESFCGHCGAKLV